MGWLDGRGQGARAGWCIVEAVSHPGRVSKEEVGVHRKEGRWSGVQGQGAAARAK